MPPLFFGCRVQSNTAPNVSQKFFECMHISIHAPRAGGDFPPPSLGGKEENFNPRPRAGGD